MPLDTFLLLAIPAAVILAVLFWFLRKGSASEKAKARDRAQQPASVGDHPPAEPSSAPSGGRSAATAELAKAEIAAAATPIPNSSAIASRAVPPSLVVPDEPASSDDVFVDDSAFDEPDHPQDGAPLEALTEPLSDQAPTVSPPAAHTARRALLSEDRTPVPGSAPYETALKADEATPKPAEATPKPARAMPKPAEATPKPARAMPKPEEAAAPTSAQTPPPVGVIGSVVAEPSAAVATPVPGAASVPRVPPSMPGVPASVPRVPPSMPRVPTPPPLPAVPVAARSPLGSSPGVVDKPAARAPLGSSPGVVDKPAARAPLSSKPALAEAPAARPALSSKPAVAEAPAARPALSSNAGVDGATAPSLPRALRNLRVTPTSELEKSDPRHQAARRFARLAVSEILLYHEADVRAGRQAKDLWTRFKADIDLCLSTYDKRFPKEVRDRFDYLYDELVHQLAEGDPEKLGPHAPRPVIAPTT